MTREILPNRRCLAYAMPVITTACLMTPLGVLQGIYAKYFGLPLTVIATVLLLSRLFDAITDPLVAYYADRYYQRTGTYKPIIVTGGLLFIFCSYFLYVPPADVSVFYFTSWFFAFYFAWTLFEIPHLAAGSKLAKTSEEKVRIYSFRSVACYSGWIIFYIIPLLPIFSSTSITPEVLKVTVLVSACLMLPLLFLFIKNPNNKEYIQTQVKERANQGESSVKRNNLQRMYASFCHLVKALINNKPLLIYSCAFSLITISSGMWYGLIFLYVDAYLGLGKQYASLFLFAFLIGIVGTPVWFKLAVRWGKKTVWAISTLILISTYIGTGILSPENADFTKLLSLKSIQTLSFACTAMVTPAILSEIIDYGELVYKTDNSASYFAIQAFLTKTCLAVATAMGIGIAGFFGFDATATVHNPDSVFGMILAIAWLPPIFAGCGLILIFLLPINERRHKIIRRKLEKIKGKRNTELNQMSSLKSIT